MIHLHIPLSSIPHLYKVETRGDCKHSIADLIIEQVYHSRHFTSPSFCSSISVCCFALLLIGLSPTKHFEKRIYVQRRVKKIRYTDRSHTNVQLNLTAVAFSAVFFLGLHPVVIDDSEHRQLAEPSGS